MSGVNWMDGESEGRQEDLALSTTGRVYGPYSLLYILAFAVDRRHAELIYLAYFLISGATRQSPLYPVFCHWRSRIDAPFSDPQLMGHVQLIIYDLDGQVFWRFLPYATTIT